jgi:anti-anti-sigma regulatory factor
MSIQVAYYQEEDRLDLIVEENLDLTLTRQILEACQFIDERLLTCVIDCSGVVRIFDSGLALMMLVVKKLKRFRVRLVLIGEIPGLNAKELPLSTIAVTD